MQLLKILVTRTNRGDTNGTLKLKNEEDERQDGITVIQRSKRDDKAEGIFLIF